MEQHRQRITEDRDLLIRMLADLKDYLSFETDKANKQVKDKVGSIEDVQREIRCHIQGAQKTKWSEILPKFDELLQTKPILPESALPAITSTIPHSGLSDQAREIIRLLCESGTVAKSLAIPKHSFSPPTIGYFHHQISLSRDVDLLHRPTLIDDLCWTPEGELLVARCAWRHVLKYELDLENLTVLSQEEVYKGEVYRSVHCAEDGSWGVALPRDHIKLNLRGAPRDLVWSPQEVPCPRSLIFYNDEIWVIPGKKGPVHVYDKKQRHMRCVNVGKNEHTLEFVTLSNGRLIATTGFDGHLLKILNLSDGSLINAGGVGWDSGKFNHPLGVATDPTGHILVCDRDNKRVSVFTTSGLFLNHLDLEWGNNTSPMSIAVRARVGKPPLMAVGSQCGNIRIYEIY